MAPENGRQQCRIEKRVACPDVLMTSGAVFHGYQDNDGSTVKIPTRILLEDYIEHVFCCQSSLKRSNKGIKEIEALFLVSVHSIQLLKANQR